ncbi:MAG: SLC13 family permease [Acutalibacteraceae bacterium]|nr:SLC13 family permease [Acutalibacteraceae bacterium]
MMVAPIAAAIIFVAMFVLIVADKIERHIVTLGCGFLTLVGVFLIIRGFDLAAVWETLSLESFTQLHFWWADPNVTHEGGHGGIDWATILFIAGMMVMVEGMAKSGFFRWLCMLLAKWVNYKSVPLFITFMVMSACLAMFIDSITVILFLAAITIELARLLKFSPVPMILAEIFCANLGGSSTMCGDPPNIIIGSALGYSFTDFLLNTGLMAGISLVAVVIYFYLVNRKTLMEADKAEKDLSAMPTPASAIVNMKDFIVSICIFLLAVVLLVTHANTGLSVATIGVGIAIITLIAAGKDIPHILKGVDYKTLLFFVGLFIVVGGLEQTGVLKIIADFIASISGGNVMVICAIIIWFSAVASAFVDNIPFAATMVPIIVSLAGPDGTLLATLAWSLAMGTDIGGCATPIGASANVVGPSVAAKNGYMIGWGKFCKQSVPATIIVLTISTLVIFLRYC